MGRVRSVAVLAGLGMAAYWAGEASEVRIPRMFGWGAGLALGAEYVWLAFLMGLGAIAAVHLIWERQRKTGWWKRAVLLAAGASALVPIGVGLGQRSVTGVAAAMVVAVALWNGLGKDARDRSAGTGNVFPALVVAVCLELGIGLLAAGRLDQAAVLAAVGTWMFLWGWKRKGWVKTKREVERWPVGVRAGAWMALAIFLCALAVVRYPPVRGEAATAAGKAKSPGSRPTETLPQEFSGNLGGGDWPGVVVYPEVERHTMLIPPIPSLRKDPFAQRRGRVDPVSIPFFGAYWYFRKPNERPPDGSPVMRGTPAKMRFLTWDGSPIQMEARQNLAASVELAACAGIQVTIRSTDQYPGTVWMRLILADTPKLVEWDLGEQAVTSIAHWRPGNAAAATEETLTFALESPHSLDRFDEFRVVYRMAKMRWGRSAKVAIQRFVLLPRTGLSGPV